MKLSTECDHDTFNVESAARMACSKVDWLFRAFPAMSRRLDSRRGFIEVRRGVVLRQEITTKSHKIRRVDMSHQLQETLHALKEVRQLEAMSKGQDMVPWVFVSPTVTRWDNRNLRRGWSRCLEAAGIRHIRFHDLRHTYASTLAQQGVSPKYVQAQLGHSSIQVTMDVYSHLFETRSRDYINQLDDSNPEGGLEEENATLAQPVLMRAARPTAKVLK